MYVPMVLKIAGDRVAAAVADAIHSRADFAPVYYLHVQDEADIKLRSRADDGIEVLRRSRASKVQQNVLAICDTHASLDVPTELIALGDKTALTLATCFESLVRSTASTILRATCGGA